MQAADHPYAYVRRILTNEFLSWHRCKRVATAPMDFDERTCGTRPGDVTTRLGQPTTTINGNPVWDRGQTEVLVRSASCVLTLTANSAGPILAGQRDDFTGTIIDNNTMSYWVG